MNTKFVVNSTDYISNQQYDENVEPDRFAPMTGKNNYRSGRIVSQKQLEMLKKRYGIKRVINLAKDAMIKQYDPTVPCRGTESLCEPVWAERLGLEYIPVYLGSRPPSEKDWIKIKNALSKGNTLVHCTWGVDRTGTIVGAWKKTVEPDLTDQQVLDYTYAFGGQWRMAGDPNRHLRNWLLSIEHDSQQKIVKRKVEWWVFASIGVVSIPLMLLLLKKYKKTR
jgi:hypothetical protein